MLLLFALFVAVHAAQPAAAPTLARLAVHKRKSTLLIAAAPDGTSEELAAQVEEEKENSVEEPVEAAIDPTPAPAPDFHAVLKKAAKRALGGGIGGLVAGVVQVLCLMWLRTTMNYQYRHGSSTLQAMRVLYAQGGIPRFYQGLSWAIIQTPLSRFGDTACNSGVLELLTMTTLPISVRTAIAGAAAALWRVALTPVDTLKTTLQVEGGAAYVLLMEKVAKHGIGTLYAGCAATWLASFVGGYPWFMTFNALDARIPKPPPDSLSLKLCRTAFLGVSATGVSDTVANSLRVLKTTRQTSATPISYVDAAKLVISTDGWAGLFARGLGTRLITNMIQSSLFTIIWKLLEERIVAREASMPKMDQAPVPEPDPPVAPQ